MWQSITAQAEGASAALGFLAEEYLNAPLAKCRCLGVSILAWVPEAFDRLEQLSNSDTSGWTRAHAKWAAQVSRQETDARKFYAATLKEQGYNATLSRLQVLEPSLTPSANMWRFEIDKNFGLPIPDEGRRATFVFWEAMDSTLKKVPKLYGRALKEYLRGERLVDMQAPKPELVDAE